MKIFGINLTARLDHLMINRELCLIHGRFWDSIAACDIRSEAKFHACFAMRIVCAGMSLDEVARG
jgi:hypothetical protein